MDLARFSEWTRREMEAQRQQIGSYISELRPKKRARRQEPEKRQSPPQTSRNMPRAQPSPTQHVRGVEPASPIVNAQATAAPVFYARDGPLILDTANAPSMGTDQPLFTGVTVPPSLQPVGATAERTATGAAPAVTVTQHASSTPQPSGLNGTTEAIVIAASVAGAVILVSIIVVCSICYRRRKRRSIQAHPLGDVSRRPKSTSSLHSEGWRSDMSEPEKQSLIHASRSPSPSSRNQPTAATTHSQHRSLGGYRPFLPQIPESPIGPIQSQPTSPTSIYTKAQSPPQPRDVGQLQVEQQQQYQPPLSPLRPPPLRLTSRRGSEAPVGTAMLPSPKNPFSSVRIPFISSAPTGNNRRRSSAQQSADGAAGVYDEETALAGDRRTVESDTLPKAAGGGRWRDSFWSVATSSIWGSNNSTKVKSGYSEWNTVPSSLAWSQTHTRSTSSSSNSGLIPVGRDRSHSSVYSSHSARHHSEALIPALPPMPSAHQLQQQYGHQASMSTASAGETNNVQLKGRLHSVDFWAREEREMRLGTFEPAELEGSPTPDSLAPPPSMLGGTGTPRDSTGEVIGAAVPGTPSKGFGMPSDEPQRGRETMSRSRLGADPYSNMARFPSGPGSHGLGGGVQGGYTVTVSGGGSPPMPQGYTQESDDGQRFWGRARSSSGSRARSASRGRGSGSTVATVFKQHPGEMVMI